ARGLGQFRGDLIGHELSEQRKNVGGQLAVLHQLRHLAVAQSDRLRELRARAGQPDTQLAAQFFGLDDALREGLFQRLEDAVDVLLRKLQDRRDLGEVLEDLTRGFETLARALRGDSELRVLRAQWFETLTEAVGLLAHVLEVTTGLPRVALGGHGQSHHRALTLDVGVDGAADGVDRLEHAEVGGSDRENLAPEALVEVKRRPVLIVEAALRLRGAVGRRAALHEPSRVDASRLLQALGDVRRALLDLGKAGRGTPLQLDLADFAVTVGDLTGGQ